MALILVFFLINLNKYTLRQYRIVNLGGEMTKADIVEQVSEATGLTKVETEAVLDGVIFYIIDSLKRGERVDMRGFGSFLVKQRPPREARNPATSEIVKLNERFDPVFKVSKLLKKSVNQSLLRGF